MLQAFYENKKSHRQLTQFLNFGIMHENPVIFVRVRNRNSILQFRHLVSCRNILERLREEQHLRDGEGGGGYKFPIYRDMCIHFSYLSNWKQNTYFQNFIKSLKHPVQKYLQYCEHVELMFFVFLFFFCSNLPEFGL